MIFIKKNDKENYKKAYDLLKQLYSEDEYVKQMRENI